MSDSDKIRIRNLVNFTLISAGDPSSSKELQEDEEATFSPGTLETEGRLDPMIYVGKLPVFRIQVDPDSNRQPGSRFGIRILQLKLSFFKTGEGCTDRVGTSKHSFSGGGGL
jgi:hypothetical protein